MELLTGSLNIASSESLRKNSQNNTSLQNSSLLVKTVRNYVLHGVVKYRSAGKYVNIVNNHTSQFT